MGLRHGCHAALGGVAPGLRWVLLAPGAEVLGAPQRSAPEFGRFGEVRVAVDEVVQRLPVDPEEFGSLFGGDVTSEVHGPTVTAKVSPTTDTVRVVKLLDWVSMNHAEQVTCSGTIDGLPCPRLAATSSPFPICQQHRVEIAMSVNREVLGNELSSLMAVPTTPLPRPDAVDVGSLLKGPHEEIVYFIANGGRVKIGFTKNLKSRLSALSLRRDNMLTALAGGPELEQALHAHFSEHRHGNTEWFELAPEIVRYITEVSKDPRPAGPKGSEEVEIEEIREPVHIAAPMTRESILVRALQVIDDLGSDRATREQLATQLTDGDDGLLRTQMREAGCCPIHPIRANGLPARGWYRSEIEEALSLLPA